MDYRRGTTRFPGSNWLFTNLGCTVHSFHKGELLHSHWKSPQLNPRQALFSNQLTQLLAVGPTKLSVLLFYRRIYRGRSFSIITWSLMAVVIALTVVSFLGSLL